MNCRSYFFILITISATSTSAQSRKVVAEDNGARMYEVAKDVYAILHDDATDEWPHGNSGVVIGDREVLVVDATYLPSRAEADISLIRKVTNKPVRYLVYTHWHFDHNNGAIAYVKAFPGIQVISERNTKRYTELNGSFWSKMSSAPQSYKRKSLAELDYSVATKKDSKGNALSEEEMGKIALRIQQRKNELMELQSLEVVSPTSVFDKDLSIDLGRRKVVLKDWGPANSPNDVTVYLPAEQILFTGDLVVQSPLPYTLNSNPVPWIEVLKQIEKIPTAVLVPGHGPVMSDHRYTQQVRNFFEATVDKTREMIAQGKTLQEIQSSLTMEEHHTGVWATGTEESKSDWKITVSMLIERASRNLRGQ